MLEPETDGQIYSGYRDPPGQTTSYIAPGNVWEEKYRLSTFRYYPLETPINPARLARNGFYWTGFRDRAKCFSCGLCVENWVQGDNESDKRWHRVECHFSNGVDRTNIPMEAAFTSFLTRLNANSTRTPSVQTATNHNDVQNSAPVMGNGVTSIENSSTGNYIAVNDISTSTTLPSSSRSNPNNAPSIPTASNINQPPEASTEQARSELFPCRQAVNPHMASAIDRLESFKSQNGVRWPREKLRASIDELANAGFFFLGERDRVKCWYCNGGLQNWDYEDDPWKEHAKWFPMCEFLLRRKGPAYVESVVREFPNLNRPQPSLQPTTSSVPGTSHPRSRGNDIPPIDEALPLAMELEYVKQAREMGIEEDLIKDVLKRKYSVNGKFYSSSEEFMDAIFSATNGLSNNHSNNEDMNGHTNLTENTELQLRELEKSRLCQICKNGTANVVLVPCGHLTTCSKCSEGIRRCPTCNRTVRDVIRTFRA